MHVLECCRRNTEEHSAVAVFAFLHLHLLQVMLLWLEKNPSILSLNGLEQQYILVSYMTAFPCNLNLIKELNQALKW